LNAIMMPKTATMPKELNNGKKEEGGEDMNLNELLQPNHCVDIAEATGSSPVPPTIVDKR